MNDVWLSLNVPLYTNIPAMIEGHEVVDVFLIAQISTKHLTPSKQYIKGTFCLCV